MRTHSVRACFIALTFVSVVASGDATGLQLPRPTPQPTVAPPPQPAPGAPAAIQRGNITLTGCVYREDQFEAFKPDPARGATADTFVLADARPSDPSPVKSQPTGTSGSRGESYKIENVPADRLATFVGKRVEVVGRIDPEPAAPGRMTEVEASQIKEVDGKCPATPVA